MVINNLCREKSYGRGYAPCLYKYTRARVRRLAVVAVVAVVVAVVAVAVAVWAVWVWVVAVVPGGGRARWRGGGGRAPHMILLYQFMQGTRNIAWRFRMSSRAKSPKIG